MTEPPMKPAPMTELSPELVEKVARAIAENMFPLEHMTLMRPDLVRCRNAATAALNASTLVDENAALKHDLIRAMDGRNAEMNARIEAEAENATLRTVLLEVRNELYLNYADKTSHLIAKSDAALSHKETNR